MVPLHRAGSARIMTGTSLVVAWLAVTTPALGETLIERGDTLHNAITEAPKLGGDSKVDLAGNIVLPHLSSIRVAGLQLDTVRARVQEKLIKHDILKSPTVLVQIAKYRPGVVEYEPGLTVRHALLLAGGAGLAEELGALSAEIPNAGASVQAVGKLAEPVAVIYRSVAGREETTKPNMKTEILPGDILDVSLFIDPAG
ncbi:polysaccharide biosynthesis/export family protein [Rhizobium sp. KVB221]|uniref:Polysaccharide biosynthesis/export family protein n=1 Tax=Rhizobium setariae TaxID=2801340 RepID=A0A936YQG3_9HYPH|nr:polysaccharide biosynthesis/export family protein [Rhizobium setariae]MBL0373803.1 polysaccharide biosynthesis/export family protein [Rhizobium setariae]